MERAKIPARERHRHDREGRRARAPVQVHPGPFRALGTPPSRASPARLGHAGSYDHTGFVDSLDGTLARERKIERPRYGFYLDHLTDAYSTFIIGLGLGLSPYMLLSIALGIVIAYMVMSINVYLETHVYGEFSFGYGMMGPTEIRIVLIAINTAALIVGPFRFQFMGQPMTVFDIVGLVIFLVLFGLLTARATQNLRRLSRLEPPAGKARSLDSDGEASQ
jgi:phosphatidylglycerophosphate synthase